MKERDGQRYAFATMTSDACSLARALVLARSLKAEPVRSVADVVIFLFPGKGNFAVPKEQQEAIQKELPGVKFMEVTEPIAPEETAEPERSIVTKISKWWDFVKLRAFELEE